MANSAGESSGTMASPGKGFQFKSEAPLCSQVYVFPQVLSFCPKIGESVRVLDVGCGNGATLREFAARGCKVVGIDLSPNGIEMARAACPVGRFEVLAADEGILKNLGEEPFDIVISTEVVEHLYDPQAYARGGFAATRLGGRFICSTPYHGYLKNLALSLMNAWDRHTSPLHLGGHIRFFSRTTLTELFTNAGYRGIEFKGAGRVPYLWKSMVMCGTRPQ
jgi:2-polyprenyl-3-methyl-5-hydroxy-6-metoxy-1,4-benzoquinol methylase